MDLRLQNKVALVGASTKGLGRACALRLASEGAQVAICGRSAESLRAAVDAIQSSTGSQVLPVQADLSKPDDIQRLVQTTQEALGPIDILVVNSGGPPPGSFSELTPDDWDAAYRSVLLYVVQLYRLIVPSMKSRRWGRIIHIASLAVREPSETLLLSSVFRAAVLSLAKAMSRGLVVHGITVNALCPGAFKTDRAISLIEAQARRTGRSPEEVENDMARTLPLGSFQDPQELADAVAFLASESARGITGTNLPVDAGASHALL